jgi:hypothetical protein
MPDIAITPAAPEPSSSIFSSRKTRKAIFGVFQAIAIAVAGVISQKYGLDEAQATKLVLGGFAFVAYLMGQDIKGTALEDAALKTGLPPPLPPSSPPPF